METIKLNTPTTWNELSIKQLFYATKHLLIGIPENAFLVKCLIKFSKIKLLKRIHRENGIEHFRLKFKRKKFLLTAEEFTLMTKQLKWLLSDSTLTKNPIPIIKLFRKKLFGPADCLYNITLSEFIYAEMNFISFCKSQHIVYLNNIIAILWRPQVKPYKPNSPDYKGDVRERFNESNWPNRSKKLYWLKLYKKYALFVFYSGARTAMQKEFPRVFSNTQTQDAKPKNMASQMMDLVRAVNGGDPSKNESLLSINIRDILGEMEAAHEKVANLKKNK